jgi:energy-converting hydrogenase Eha subunit F
MPFGRGGIVKAFDYSLFCKGIRTSGEVLISNGILVYTKAIDANLESPILIGGAFVGVGILILLLTGLVKGEQV